jgi:hypothetical protein
MDIVTEDGVVVKEGQMVYNYYEMKPGVIIPGSICMAPDPWFDVQHEDGTTSLLNGQRICTIEFAKRRGFPLD